MLQNAASTEPAPQRIARRMMPTIRRIASQLARRLPRHICVDDLVSAGSQGLCSALERFDATREDCFEQYAETRIRGAMFDELRANDPLSRDQRLRAKRMTAAGRVLEARLGRAADAEELAQELGIDLETLWAWQSASATYVDAAPPRPGDQNPMGELSDARAEPADDRLHRCQRERAVHRAIAALPDRLRKVVALHYDDELTLRRIGEELGVSESRVCQLEAEAIRRIRERCGRPVAAEHALTE